MSIITILPSLGFQEAPMLTELVEKGVLPPVEQRLPEDPVIVNPEKSIGKYGGTWRRLCINGWDTTLDSRMSYESLVRWDRSGYNIVPGIAKSWEIADEGKKFIFHLHQGIRWSDGEPLTSEDFIFYCNDVLKNKAIRPIFPRWFLLDGEAMEISAPNPYTIVIRFPKPYGIFLEVLAVRGTQFDLFGPKHYLKQFHEKYADATELKKMAREAGFESWRDLFEIKSRMSENPDLPVLAPFRLRIPPPATRIIAERNPYYWKVDPQGNQLPYIDRIAFTVVDYQEIINFKAIAGDVDFQARRIQASNYSLFMQNKQQGNYHVLRDYSPDCPVIYVNQCSRDTEIRDLLQDKRFRIALSIAINRKELIDFIYSGMAKPSRAISHPQDPYYLPEYDEKYLEYNPALANRLLDELGMQKQSSGFRTMPNGKRFKRILNIYPAELGTSADLWQLVVEYFREVGLEFVVKIENADIGWMQAVNGNIDFWASQIWFMNWVVDPQYYFPMTDRSFIAPLYGMYVSTNGLKGIKPPEEYMRMTNWFHELSSAMNKERRLELGRRILSQWAEESYVIGICRPELLTIVSNDFKNVPENIIHSWTTRTPGYLNIEQFYLDREE